MAANIRFEAGFIWTRHCNCDVTGGEAHPIQHSWLDWIADVRLCGVSFDRADIPPLRSGSLYLVETSVEAKIARPIEGGGAAEGYNAHEITTIMPGGRALAYYNENNVRGTYFEHPDALGTVTEWTDESGNVAIGNQMFYPWGEAWGEQVVCHGNYVGSWNSDHTNFTRTHLSGDLTGSGTADTSGISVNYNGHSYAGCGIQTRVRMVMFRFRAQALLLGLPLKSVGTVMAHVWPAGGSIEPARAASITLTAIPPMTLLVQVSVVGLFLT